MIVAILRNFFTFLSLFFFTNNSHIGPLKAWRRLCCEIGFLFA